MSNWEYANDVPTSPWRSAMTIPRALSLRKTDAGWLLLQQPVRELEQLRGKPVTATLKDVKAAADLSALKEATAGPFELEADLMPSADAVFHLKLLTGAVEETVLRVDVPNRKLTLDRTRSGRVDFHKRFPGAAVTPVRLIDGRMKLRLFVDTSSVEVFVNDGETVLTSLILPTAADRRLELAVAKGELRRADLRVWKLASAWMGR